MRDELGPIEAATSTISASDRQPATGNRLPGSMVGRAVQSGMTRRLVSIGLAAGLLTAAAAAQQHPTFRGGSDVVRIFATVLDRDGRIVTTLTKEQFEVRDEGKPQPLTQFDNTPQPIRIIVMLDVSG